MAKTIVLALLTSNLVWGVFSSPAPFNERENYAVAKREPQAQTVTVTATVTTTRVSTVTMCPTGSSTTSTSRPPTTTASTTRPPTTTTTTTKNGQTTTASTSATSPSGEPTFNGCTWNVEGAGQFKNKKVFTFFEPGIPSGLYASNYIVYDTYNGLPYNHKFETSNVYSDGNFLNLKVQGTTDPSSLPEQTISSAEIVTTENNILYASVRTNAIFSTVPGTCHGIFFYLDDTQECDIEYLTDPNSQANNIYQSSSSGAPIPLWYSNQALRSGQKATNGVGPAPWDVTAVHEYRVDWTKDFTAFYLDGVLQKKYTTNVPTKPGSWIWNNWANGDPSWSVGPPKEDNIMKIQNITMYYNTSDDKSCT